MRIRNDPVLEGLCESLSSSLMDGGHNDHSMQEGKPGKTRLAARIRDAKGGDDGVEQESQGFLYEQLWS